jgi:hypothetical protein
MPGVGGARRVAEAEVDAVDHRIGRRHAERPRPYDRRVVAAAHEHALGRRSETLPQRGDELELVRQRWR